MRQTHTRAFARASLACVFLLTTVSPSVAQTRTARALPVSAASGTPQVTLLREFRPIGGSGNNLPKPGLDVLPGNPELAIAPLNFAPNTNDGLVAGPNPRTISNVIAGGTG